ncbi:MAG: Sapep family Mn(2+)-dependent dipeptidase [Clostridiales Family XIII bacterium]|jgi:succinyl-diaminopimelate desuccinylase|nr:Sapep family Mn(2+)-dependent dipeptidase [Clostridiales Family XIII bacterium]
MDYKEIIKQYEDAAVRTLQELVRIPSVMADALPDKPFGEEVNRAFEYMLELGRQADFDTVNVDGWGGHIEWAYDPDAAANVTNAGANVNDATTADIDTPLAIPAAPATTSTTSSVTLATTPDIPTTPTTPAPQSPKVAPDEILGIPVHVDVVPVGDGWAFDPFSAEIKDGLIYGRGTTDNRGGVVAIYYAMKALKESGYKPGCSIRLILGNDEETGWHGMDRYLEDVGLPTFGFSPDTDFPAINGEMGIMNFDIAMKLEGDVAAIDDTTYELASLTGGQAPNMVPERCRAVLKSTALKSIQAKAGKKSKKKGIDVGPLYKKVLDKVGAYKERTGYDITAKIKGKSLEIITLGIAAHGSIPEQGLNAVTIMMDFLREVPLDSDKTIAFIDFYNEYIGFELGGESLGLDLSDAPSGHLVFNVGMIKIDKEAIILTVNVRYPVTKSSDDVYAILKPLVTSKDMGIVVGMDQKPIFFPADEPFIRTLVDVYREVTGDTQSEPRVIGGGTYARAIPRAVAYGPRFPGREDLMHKRDEYLHIEDFIKSIYIFAGAIKKLTE